MIFLSEAKDEFDIRPITSADMDRIVSECMRIYGGAPDWVDPEANIKSINFAKTLCDEIGRLTTLASKITIDGSSRAKWLQEQIDVLYPQLQNFVSYGSAYGTLILKPNGKNVDIVTPENYIITQAENNQIRGIVFYDQRMNEKGDRFYNRLEYHRFLPNGKYVITNKCYIGETKNDKGKPIDIKKTPWAKLSEEVSIDDLTEPLFGVFRTGISNNIDVTAPIGLPAFHDAITELQDLDIAYSRNTHEILESQRLVAMDSDRLLTTKLPGGKPSAPGMDYGRKELNLPEYVRFIQGTGDGDIFHEIIPTLQTPVRIVGIDHILAIIGFKCGFSTGYFTIDQKSGMVTATQVEAEDRRTIQTIKGYRDQLEACLNGLIGAMDTFATLYELAPDGEYEVTYDFGDITYNREEDRARWFGYVSSGIVPKWYYLQKFEGLSEEEAKQLVTEAMPKEPEGSAFEVE